eukprot:SAG22_NODE_12078_length_457_cov_0.863128_1_plen_23_part_10
MWMKGDHPAGAGLCMMMICDQQR